MLLDRFGLLDPYPAASDPTRWGWLGARSPGYQPSAMVALDIRQPDTTLTYAHDGTVASFEGVVDATNLEIFRDFLAMLPSRGDVVLSIADLELRIPEAALLLVERARTLVGGARLVLVAGPDRPISTARV